MHEDSALVEARLQRFVLDRIEPAVVRERAPLAITAWTAPGEPVPFAEAVGQSYEEMPLGAPWGAPWGTTWFRARGEVPRAWRSVPGTRVEVRVDLGYDTSQPGFQAEALAYRPDGSPLKAIHPRNSWVHWRPEDGEAVDVLLEAASNPDVAGADWRFRPTPLGDRLTAGAEPLYRLANLDVALVDVEVDELLQDVGVLRGLLQQLPAEQTRRHELLRALERMLDVLDPADIAGTAADARAELAEVLSRPANASAHRIVAVGHAHIDSAWLWPARETVRKCARTFANVIALMDEHPDLVFACSSAQQYAWMREHYPALWERIREKVAEGRFVPVGGMWVESDTNMPGSEAMARQFVAGKRFFLEHFGVECEEAWLPDSFGYSAALPQIVRAAGERWFLTQKISWNQVNRMPHHTFWWEGIDGSRVFTHFPPADTYNSDLSATDLARSERNFADKGLARTVLLPFGYGNGGGGPTREMIGIAHRTASLEGSPAVRIDRPDAFFREAEAEYPDAPVWAGEMYLELHRGVYTSQHRTKAGNRRNERLLREAELWATTAAVRVGHPYPQEVLDRCWRAVLLLQFHDILPGSAIAWVHREAEQQHAEVTAALETVIEEALAALAGTGDQLLTVNPAPHPWSGVPALALGVADAPPAPVEAEETPDGTVLRNGLVSVLVDRQGRIASLRAGDDGRDLVPSGDRLGRLRLHHDLPNLWDAWDLDAHYRRSVTELDGADDVRLERAVDGCVAVTSVRSTARSRFVQRVALRPGAAEVELELDVDWHEREKILKLTLPVDVRAESVAAETQFGHVRRPTHSNTSWDAARFEVCQHRWLHLGEPGFGVTVTNDASYGYDVERTTREDGGTTTTAGVSVLRSPRFPDPETDQGRHRFRYTIAPDTGIADAVRLGYRAAGPPRTLPGAGPVAPLVTSSDPAAVIETVKLAEDGSGDVVVRLYESLGGRATTRVRLDAPHSGTVVTDLLERRTEDAAVGEDGAVELLLRPFQLVTLRFARNTR